MKSRRAIRNSKAAPRSDASRVFASVAGPVLLSAAAPSAFFYSHGWTLYGTAMPKRTSISRAASSIPRPQATISSAPSWLPLLHVLMLPLVARDQLWRTGLAGSFAVGASASCVAGAFLFASVRRIFGSSARGRRGRRRLRCSIPTCSICSPSP